jgi:hypothetical protein
MHKPLRSEEKYVVYTARAGLSDEDWVPTFVRCTARAASAITNRYATALPNSTSNSADLEEIGQTIENCP